MQWLLENSHYLEKYETRKRNIQMEQLRIILKTWEQVWQSPDFAIAILQYFPLVLALSLVPFAFVTFFSIGRFRKLMVTLCLSLNAGILITAATTSWLTTGFSAPSLENPENNFWWIALLGSVILILASFGNKIWRSIGRLLFFIFSFTFAGYVLHHADTSGQIVGGKGTEEAAPTDASPSQPNQEPETAVTSNAPQLTDNPPSTATPPAPPSPKPATPSAAENQAQLVLSQAGLYEAKPGVWYLKQVNNFSPRVYNRLSTDGDVRAALRALGGQLPPRTDWGKRP